MTNKIGPFTRVVDFEAEDALWEFVLPILPGPIVSQHHLKHSGYEWFDVGHSFDFTFDENGYFCTLNNVYLYLYYHGHQATYYARSYYCFINGSIDVNEPGWTCDSILCERPLHSSNGEFKRWLSGVRLPPPVRGYWRRSFELPLHLDGNIHDKYISYYGELTHSVFAHQWPYRFIGFSVVFPYVAPLRPLWYAIWPSEATLAITKPYGLSMSKPLSLFRRISKKTGEVLWESKRVRCHHRTIPTVRTVNGKPRKVIEFWGFVNSPTEPELYDTYPRL